jgi:hypothetical protein
MGDILLLNGDVKLNIHLEPIDGLTMDDYDFDVEAYCSTRNVLKFRKDELIRVDGSNFKVAFNTADIGAGEIKIRVIARIPDGDFPDGIRDEPWEVNTKIEVVKRIE